MHSRRPMRNKRRFDRCGCGYIPKDNSLSPLCSWDSGIICTRRDGRRRTRVEGKIRRSRQRGTAPIRLSVKVHTASRDSRRTLNETQCIKDSLPSAIAMYTTSPSRRDPRHGSTCKACLPSHKLELSHSAPSFYTTVSLLWPGSSPSTLHSLSRSQASQHLHRPNLKHHRRLRLQAVLARTVLCFQSWSHSV
jgi:hypothetical protein